jgi:hypothetical protein
MCEQTFMKGVVMAANVVQVQRGRLLSVNEAGAILGLPSGHLRLWLRMGLLYAQKIGKTYVVRSEDLAEASRRYHNDCFVDAPHPREGSLNLVVLI